MDKGKKKWRKNDITVEAVLVLIFTVICVVTLYPILNVLAISLSADGYVLRGDVTFYPKELTLTAYGAVMKNQQILKIGRASCRERV